MTPCMIQNFNGESTEKCSKLSIAQGFVVHTDHQVRRFNQSQEKLNAKESKWVFFLSSCVIRHKAGKRNVVADALSRRAMLLQSVETVVHYEGSGELLLDWLGTLKDLFSRVVFVRNKKVARGLYSQARKLAPSSSPIFAPLPDKAHPFAESFLPKKEE
ncbi:hypothetical protein V6N12_013740 [Hibiscus sabdariffa]|uniref:Reverse transcriptase RNase H-like domain-containing protein n=1 Tax=Hibiscus sabdariffa TaxID=183260 RepID=A0ABR2CV34_9ROSI